MEEDKTKLLLNVFKIDDERIQDCAGTALSALKHILRGSAENTLNAVFDAEAELFAGPDRCERSEARRDTRARSPGRHHRAG
ncbi:MAG: hypothetical protein QNJ30_18485 [Kiloniellales bacterium]|nr:hypothetical protein [Kiloniellales bacterium]